MQLGTSIFLSSLFIGAVLLFIATKDRWKWKKIGFFTVGGILALTALLGIGMFLVNYFDERPRIETALCGVSIKIPKSEVKFLKGEPAEQQHENLWLYPSKSGEYATGDAGTCYVSFREDNVRLVAYSGKPYDTAIQGIYVEHLLRE